MKEHALFLKAGFPCCEKDFIEEAEYFLRIFEELLNDTLKISAGNVHEAVLNFNDYRIYHSCADQTRYYDIEAIDAEDTGEKGYNYRSERFDNRLKQDIESGMWGIFRVMKQGLRCKCKNTCHGIWKRLLKDR